MFKKLLIIILSLTMVSGLFGCNDKNSNLETEYIFLPKTRIQTYQNSGGFHGEYKYTYKYDSYGNIVKEEQYTKGLFYSPRDYCIDRTYTYDESGKITKELIRKEEFTTNLTDSHTISEEGYNYFYNESGQLIKKEYIYISFVESEFSGYKYEYDEKGNCIKENRYFSDGTEKTNFEYIYNSNNNLIKRRHIVHSTSFDSQYVSAETDYNYDDEGKLIYSKTIQKESSGEMSNYKEHTYHYDKHGRLIKEESALIDKDGKLLHEYVEEYKNFVKITPTDVN